MKLYDLYYKLMRVLAIIVAWAIAVPMFIIVLIKDTIDLIRGKDNYLIRRCEVCGQKTVPVGNMRKCVNPECEKLPSAWRT